MGQRAETILAEVRALGYYPRENANNKEEALLATKLRKAIKDGIFLPHMLEELEQIRSQNVHPNDHAKLLDFMEEASQPPDPMMMFADAACNKLDQDLLQLENGERGKALLRRLKQYKEFVKNCVDVSQLNVSPAASADASQLGAAREFAKKYAERILNAASASSLASLTYVRRRRFQGF